MKRASVYLMIFGSVALFFSCSKSMEGLEASLKRKVFTASLENSGTKTALDNSLNVNWVKDDKIYIVGNECKAIYKARTGGSTQATFDYVEGETLTQGPYYAYYPHSVLDESSLILGSQLNYDPAHSFCFNPMYATGNSTNLEFCNLCGILKLTIDKETCENVSKVRLASDSHAVSGGFEIVADDDKYRAKFSCDTSLYTVYDCIDPVSLADSAAKFYFYLPPSSYGNFIFSVVDGNDQIQNMTVKMKPDTVSSHLDPNDPTQTIYDIKERNISIERNKIYSISFRGSQSKGVKLIPKFVSCESGTTTINLPIYSENDFYFRDLKFTIEYPDGMLTAKSGKKYPVTINKDRLDTGDDATVTVYAADGTSVSFTNSDLDLVKPGDGLLLTVPITLTDAITEGEYTIKLKNIKCYVTNESADDIKTVIIPDTQTFVRVCEANISKVALHFAHK